jgi:hypothetical protein
MADNIVGTKIVIDSSQATQSVGSIKKQLREATQDLVAMADKFGEGSIQATNAAKRVAELRDRIGDAKSMADAFNPDAKFRAFSQSIQGVASGFAAVQGAMGLLGVESENVSAQLLKVQSALALSEGLNTFLDNGIQGFKNLKNLLVDFSSNLFKNFGPGGIAVLVTGVATAIYQVVNALKAENEIQQTINQQAKDSKKTRDELTESTAKEIAKIEVLYQTATDLNASYSQRKKAVGDLQNQYPDYFGSLKQEDFLTGKAAQGYDALTQSLIRNIEVKAKEKELTDTITKRVQLEQEFSRLTKQTDENTFVYSDPAAVDKVQKELAFYKQKEDSLLRQSRYQREVTNASLGVIGTGNTGATAASKNPKVEAIKIEQLAIESLNTSLHTLDVKREQSTIKNIDLTEKNIRIAKLEAEARSQAYSDISMAIGMLSNAAEQGSDLQKGLALAQIAIDTGIAISNLTATSSAPTPDNLATGGLSGFAKYAVGIAKIIANIAQARNLVMSSNKSAGAGSPSQGGMSAPVYPNMPISQTITSLNQGTINALGNQAIKAYVLESDVTNSQGRVTRILNSSRFK